MAYKCPLCGERIFNDTTKVFILTNQRRVHEKCLKPLLKEFKSKNKPVGVLYNEYKKILFQEGNIRKKKIYLEIQIEQLQQEFNKATSVIHKITSFFTGSGNRKANAIKEELLRYKTAYNDIINKIKLNSEQNEETFKKLENAILKREPIYETLKPLFHYWPTYPPDWHERCDEILRKKARCKISGEHFGSLHVHHIKPLSLGGSNKISNLKVLCERHHLKEHKVSKFEDEGEEKETGIDIIPNKVVFNKKISMLNKAIKHKEKIFMRYQNKYGERTKRTIEPFNIYKLYNRIYVEAYCHLRSENRTFRVSRILSLGNI